MELIKAEENHISELVKISKQAFDSDTTVGAVEAGGPPEYDSYDWHLEMMNQGHLFTAMEEEKIVGGAIVFVDKDNCSLMYIGRIFVNPDFFRKGYGIQIMEKLEKLNSDISVWKLDTPIWNKRTNQFYKKLEYVETGRDAELVYYEKKKKGKNIYEKCPVLENDSFWIRLLEEKDIDDLLKVYSDKHALPYFNSDNCNGSNFYCTKREQVQEAVKWWLWEYYENKGFVRFSIVDKVKEEVIGTIEMFHRDAEDFYTDCGLLRLDVRSDYENTQSLYEILSLIVEPSYELFDCSLVATKAPIYAVDRIEALKKMNFMKSSESLVGHDGKMVYYDYWVREGRKRMSLSETAELPCRIFMENCPLKSDIIWTKDFGVKDMRTRQQRHV